MFQQRTHGESNGAGVRPMTPEYTAWLHMRQRCNNPRVKDYKYYGGRGIKVCARWNSYEVFLADMGRKPKGRSLDRINNEGNYEPGNCRWATKLQQVANTRVARWIEYNGKRKVLSQWARDLGVLPSHLHWHLQRRSEQEAIEYLLNRKRS